MKKRKPTLRLPTTKVTTQANAMPTRNGTRQVRPPTTPYELRLARIIAGLRINDVSKYTGISTPTRPSRSWNEG